MSLIILYLSLNISAGFNIPVVGNPLPETDWEVTEVPEWGIYDAVIIESVVEFRPRSINHYKKVRILSEKGKEAASFIDNSGQAINLKGRVITRSGEEIRIDTKMDLLEVLSYKMRGKSKYHRVLLPPGLTNDCIVEYSWSFKANEGLALGHHRQSYPVQAPWFVKKSVFFMENEAFKPASSLVRTRWAYYTPPYPARFLRGEIETGTLLVFEEIPARADNPFSQEYFDPMAASVVLYQTLPPMGQDPGSFWPTFARDYVGGTFRSDIKVGGKAYKAWIAELKASLPEDRLQAALFVYDAFRKKISPMTLLPPARRKQLAEEGEINRRKNHFYQEAFDRGYGDPDILCALFMRVALDLDLGLKIIFTNSHEERRFEPQTIDPFNLYLDHPFFGVPTKGGWVVLSPAWAEYPPGLFPSMFQARPALAIDMKTWNHQFIRMPYFDSSYHQLTRNYSHRLDDDGSMSFSFHRKGSGEFNAEVLRQLLPLPEAEQVNLIRQEWQQNWEIESVQVLNADSATSTVEYRVNGSTRKKLEGASWIAIDPFPGARQPLSTPTNWPTNRAVPIYLDFPLSVTDQATIIIPKNWTIRSNANWEKSNDFGRVSFQAVQEGNQVRVRREITLEKNIADARMERDLKNFLAWMDEAMEQTLGLNLEAAPLTNQ